MNKYKRYAIVSEAHYFRRAFSFEKGYGLVTCLAELSDEIVPSCNRVINRTMLLESLVMSLTSLQRIQRYKIA